MAKQYETVIGLEVHIELATKTKIFCGCSTEFGGAPNTHTCPVCTGMPGSLPVLNKQVVEYAMAIGLATNCKITQVCKFDRKNYFYPDNPQNYQISQLYLPIARDGYVEIESGSGKKKVRIHEMHMEEDAGKLVHDEWDDTSLVDYNRSGVPLVEIVSEPDMRSAEEVIAYLEKLRMIVQYLGASDCKLQEGSMRADVNLSVREVGSDTFGTRTEMKNLNSFTSVQRAIEEEYRRQVEAVKKGEAIVQETRRFDQNTGKTSSMRRKENANDYRYFPDPDLAPIVLSDEVIAGWRKELPQLPDVRKAAYMADYGLTAYAAEQLVSSKYLADYFETAAQSTAAVKMLANLMISEVFRLLDGEDAKIPLNPAALAKIADMTEQSLISVGTAKKTIDALWDTPEDPEEYVTRMGLMQISDEAVLAEYVRKAIDTHPEMVAGYRKGKLTLKNALMGVAMGLSGGKANPVVLQKLMDAALDA